MLEWAVVVVQLHGDQALHGIARWRQQREIALGVERAARGLRDVLVHEVLRHKSDGPGRGEIAELHEIRPLESFDELDGLRDQEMKIGITLAVGVAAQVHRQTIDEECDVGAVIGIEASEQILFRLAAALVLADDEAGNQTQHVGDPTLREKLEIATRDQHFG